MYPSRWADGVVSVLGKDFVKIFRYCNFLLEHSHALAYLVEGLPCGGIGFRYRGLPCDEVLRGDYGLLVYVVHDELWQGSLGGLQKLGVYIFEVGVDRGTFPKTLRGWRDLLGVLSVELVFPSSPPWEDSA